MTALSASMRLLAAAAALAMLAATVASAQTIANPDKKILPGMFGHVAFAAGEPAKAVTAPRTAVTYSLYGDSVYVVVADDPAKGFDGPLHVVRRSVKVGDTRDDRVVLLDGVAPGEKVVAEGQIKLQPNAPVKIDPDKSMKAQPVRPRE